MHKIALWAQNRWSYNQGGLKIEGHKIEGLLYYLIEEQCASTKAWVRDY